jgi:hypothetical protein
MAMRTNCWVPERRQSVIDALQKSLTRSDAAKLLGITAASLDHASGVYGLDVGALLKRRERPVFEDVKFIQEVSALPPGVAPWQAYRPKPGHTPPPPPGKAAKGKERPFLTVVIADLHVPHQDQTAWTCALGLIRELKPGRVVINGDFLDLESLSRHPKSSPDLAKLAAELYAGNLALDALQAAAGSADIVYLEGNHEGRARRFEAEFGQLDGVLSVPVGLYIESRQEYRANTAELRGIRWVPLRLQPFQIGAVSYLHGVFESIHHAYQHAWQLGPRCATRHLVSAHMHALQTASTASGHTATACPWLGNITAPVFGYTKGRPRPWSHGVLVIEEMGEAVTVSPVAIVNGRAVYGGRVVQAT